ncbi:MAG: helix-turn-helix transcriptional regulator [Alphaproteobacteria bacterium]|jgi:transcriptional regulator with XRE-family HTH domain|nr:helix-turn-helix transcriptional regulator [Alphaproteobacteria bacterium]
MVRRKAGQAAEALSPYETEQVGERLRALRLGRALTISALSELSGVPSSTISKIENGQLRPSLVHAINLAEALEENLGFLISRYRDRPEPVVVVRARERSTIHYGDMGLTLQDLNGHFKPGVLESRVGILEPGAHSGIDAMTHQGEEFCYVIAGAIRYRVADEIVELTAGDYLQFKSDIRHSWENAHAGETRVLWVFSNGLSF